MRFRFLEYYPHAQSSHPRQLLTPVAHTLLAVSPLITLHKSYISFCYKILAQDKFAELWAICSSTVQTHTLQCLAHLSHNLLNHAQRLEASQISARISASTGHRWEHRSYMTRITRCMMKRGTLVPFDRPFKNYVIVHHKYIWI